MAQSYISADTPIKISDYEFEAFADILSDTCIACNEKTCGLARPCADHFARAELAEFKVLDCVTQNNKRIYKILLGDIVAVQIQAFITPDNNLMVKWATRDWKQFIIALHERLYKSNPNDILIRNVDVYMSLVTLGLTTWNTYANGRMTNDWNPFNLPDQIVEPIPEPTTAPPVKSDDPPCPKVDISGWDKVFDWYCRYGKKTKMTLKELATEIGKSYGHVRSMKVEYDASRENP